MKRSAKVGSMFVRALCAVGLVLTNLMLALTMLAGIDAYSQDMIGSQLHPSVINGNLPRIVSNRVAARPLAPSDQQGVRRYVMGFGGDRSLDIATVVEQARAGYVRYMVRLQFASGAEQSIAVMAPPGGLRPEELDMTGDNVPNDLILTPALLHWPLTVLLNEGHDHYVVAISGVFPGSLGSGEDRASERHDIQSNVALLSFRLQRRLPCETAEEHFLRCCKENPIPPIAQTQRLAVWIMPSVSGRAPPRV